MSEIKFAIPKGSLEDATFKLLEKSWTKVNRKSRTYRVYLDDPSIMVKMLRPQEIPTLVAEGLYDVGITGKDWVGETNSDVESILDLEYGKIRLVIAFPDKYSYKNLDAMIADRSIAGIVADDTTDADPKAGKKSWFKLGSTRNTKATGK
jgi:ATP phosphoribosyltransferase